MSASEDSTAEPSAWHWVTKGTLGIFSPPALILTVSFIGFAALARDAGLDWVQASFMTFTIWALPAKIILVGAITAGVSLPAAALAVGLSSLRLMPMVVALLAEIRTPKTRTLTLLFLSHFVAITGWVYAMERVDQVPRERRALFFGSFAILLTVVNTIVVALVFNLMGQLPVLATGALAFLTPVYFLTSLFGSARDLSGRLALFLGILCVPPAHWLSPDFDLLIAGIGGGALAFFVGRAVEARRV